VDRIEVTMPPPRDRRENSGARPSKVPEGRNVAAPGARAPQPPRRAEVRAVLGFLARFAGGWIATLVLLSLVPAIDGWAVRRTIASLLAVMHLFRVACSAAAGSVRIAGVSIEIVPDCTPLMPTAALWIAIAAFPAPWRSKLVGLAAGAALLWLYNMARILALVPVLAYRPQLFEFIHVYMWQTFTLLVVFTLFLLWLRLQPVGAERT
jgi:exosortase/archaeosortase family protein